MDELKQLQGEALAADALSAPAEQVQLDAQGQPIPVQEAVNVASEVSAAIKIVVGILSPVLPSLKDVYTDQTIGAVSEAIAGVCNKHGWLQGGIMGKWGEEIAAAAILIPIGMATYNGVKGDLSRLQEQAKAKGGKVKPADLSAPVKAPEGAPGAKTVTMGTIQPVAVESEGGES